MQLCQPRRGCQGGSSRCALSEEGRSGWKQRRVLLQPGCEDRAESPFFQLVILPLNQGPSAQFNRKPESPCPLVPERLALSPKGLPALGSSAREVGGQVCPPSPRSCLCCTGSLWTCPSLPKGPRLLLRGVFLGRSCGFHRAWTPPSGSDVAPEVWPLHGGSSQLQYAVQ